MRPTVRQLLDWRPHLVAEAGDDLARSRRRLLSLQDEVDGSRIPPDWYGASADAARGSRRLLTGELNDLLAEVATVARAVDVAAEATLEAQRILRHALSDADLEDFRVDRDLAALVDTRSVADPHAQADRERRRAELTAHLDRALEAAGHTDDELAAVMDRVARALVDGGHGALPDAAATGRRAGDRHLLPPPIGGGPGDLNGWWRGLTAAEQRRVIDEHPGWIGNADGIPARARHLANLARLGPLRRSLARMRGAPGVEEKLAGLDRIDDLLERHPDDRQLLLLDGTGPKGMRAVIGIGDLDDAAHVTVFTPGFGSGLHDDLPELDRQLDALRRTADALTRPGQSSVVLNLGADTPQPDWSLVDLGNTSVLNDDLARAGADDLADLLNGLDASRDEDPHLTAAGHSYGSLTTGLALEHSTGVDDAVHLGSPGIGAEDLTAQDVPPGHHHALEAQWDGIADTGWFGADPSGMDGIRHLSTDAHEDPDLTASRGHSSYLEDGSTSQHNLAAVGAARPDQLIEAGEPGEIDQVREEWRRLRELLGLALMGLGR